MTLIPGPSIGTSRPSEPEESFLDRGGFSWRKVRALEWVADGSLGKFVYGAFFVHESSCGRGDRTGSLECLEASATKRERKTVTDTTTIATLASAWSQNTPQVVSNCPSAVLAAATLMILMIMRNILRHKTDARASFFLNGSRARHKRLAGMEMTVQCYLTDFSSRMFLLRIKSVTISIALVTFNEVFSRYRAEGVTQASKAEISLSKQFQGEKAEFTHPKHVDRKLSN